MKILDLFLGKTKVPAQGVHPDFGQLTYSRHDGWLNDDFELWGYRPVQLLIEGDERGPSEQQIQAFSTFRDARETLLPRCLEAVRSSRPDLEGELLFLVSGLSIPSLDASRTAGTLWTLWFDLIGDDHYMYGVQSEDDWRSLHPFMDD